MCGVMAAGLASAVAGAAMQYGGQRQQQRAMNRANNEQDFYANQQRQLALRQKQEERDFSDKRNQSIMDEAEVVAPGETRVEALNNAEEKQTASNINALQNANALGDESIASGGTGAQSDEYLAAKAKTASHQTERAIKLARLFGQQVAGNQAVATQSLGAIDHRLDQQALDAKRRSMQRGYGWMYDDLQDRGSRIKVDPYAGSGMSAVGGALMNAGMASTGKRLGSQVGKNGGWKNLFNK